MGIFLANRDGCPITLHATDCLVISILSSFTYRYYNSKFPSKCICQILALGPALSLSPVLARYDPFGVDVPLNFDNTHSLT